MGLSKNVQPVTNCWRSPSPSSRAQLCATTARCAAAVCDESVACSPKLVPSVVRTWCVAVCACAPHFFPRANGRDVDVLLNDIKNTFISIQYMRVCAHFVVFFWCVCAFVLSLCGVAARGRSDTCCAWLILFSETACVCVGLFLLHARGCERVRHDFCETMTEHSHTQPHTHTSQYAIVKVITRVPLIFIGPRACGTHLRGMHGVVRRLNLSLSAFWNCAIVVRVMVFQWRFYLMIASLGKIVHA